MNHGLSPEASSPAFVLEAEMEELDRDPYPFYERLRRDAPIAWMPAMDAWMISRWEDCERVGGDANAWIKRDPKETPGLSHLVTERTLGPGNVLNVEGEQHVDLRAGINPRLEARSVLDYIDDLVQPVAARWAESLRGKEHVELVEDFFNPVSVEALRLVLGLEGVVDTATLVRWFKILSLGTGNMAFDKGIFAQVDAVDVEIKESLGPLLERLAVAPDDSTLSHMIHTGRQGKQLRSVVEILPSIKVLLTGGMQEPGHAGATTLLGLLSNPDQLRAVSEDLDLVPQAIHEGLRWIAPAAMVERYAVTDQEIGGVRVRQGEMVILVLASANRDEERFDDGDLYDLFRPRQANQAFGHGAHLCAGNFFGRHVIRIMMEELLPRLPGLRLLPDEDPDIRGWIFRSPKRLVVDWDRSSKVVTTPADLGASPTPEVQNGSRSPGRQVRVLDKTREAKGIISFRLGSATGEPLPLWSPGAHLSLQLSGQLIRQYSLCGVDSGDWSIAVQREPLGRGGSIMMQDQFKVGDLLEVAEVRNNFELTPAGSYLFLAAGIGITALLPMVESAAASGARARVIYIAPSRDRMAFVERLIGANVTVDLWPTAERGRPDLREVRDRYPADLVYACGPTGFLEAAQELWDDDELRVEHFRGAEASTLGGSAFDVELAASDTVVTVAPDESILAAVERALPNKVIYQSCREGVCGSCETRVLSGVPDHRDLVLTSKQRQKNDRLMICVSRCQGERLVLDL